jgi:hypothetical protein
MFEVQKRISRVEDQRLIEFEPFSDGLIDLVICLVANKRERMVRISTNTLPLVTDI